MLAERFIREMPKAELNVHLAGAMKPETLAIIAEQNDVDIQSKHFRQLMHLLQHPDYHRLGEIAAAAIKWLQQPDDITRIVYELGVQLFRQNVLYAEVCVDPTSFADTLNFEQFMMAANDGRERVQRAWGVTMTWLLCIPRENPRTADEIARWATSANARRIGIVGIGLYGKEEAQPIGQFERAFRIADKKGVARVPHAGDALGAEGMRDAITALAPDRIIAGWGNWQTPEMIELLRTRQLPVDISLTRTVRLNSAVKDYRDLKYVRKLFDAGVPLTLGSSMPTLLGTTLTDEYLVLHNKLSFSLEEIQAIALNAVRFSQLPPDDKQTLLARYQRAYEQLSGEYKADRVS